MTLFRNARTLIRAHLALRKALDAGDTKAFIDALEAVQVAKHVQLTPDALWQIQQMYDARYGWSEIDAAVIIGIRDGYAANVAAVIAGIFREWGLSHVTLHVTFTEAYDNVFAVVDSSDTERDERVSRCLTELCGWAIEHTRTSLASGFPDVDGVPG